MIYLAEVFWPELPDRIYAFTFGASLACTRAEYQKELHRQCGVAMRRSCWSGRRVGIRKILCYESTEGGQTVAEHCYPLTINQ